MDLAKEYQEDFFKLLKKYKLSGVKIVSYNTNTSGIKSTHYYSAITLKIYFCELVYNAVMLFPDIYEYTIICQGSHRSTLKIGYFTELDDDGEPTIAKISNTEIGDYCLNKNDFFQIFRCNRDPTIDNDTVNSFIVMMTLDCVNPIISTSYKTKSGNKN